MLISHCSISITPHESAAYWLCIACAFSNLSSAYCKVARAAEWQPLRLSSFFYKFYRLYQWNISLNKCAEVSRHRIRAPWALSKIASKLNRCFIYKRSLPLLIILTYHQTKFPYIYFNTSICSQDFRSKLQSNCVLNNFGTFGSAECKV